MSISIILPQLLSLTIGTRVSGSEDPQPKVRQRLNDRFVSAATRGTSWIAKDEGRSQSTTGSVHSQTAQQAQPSAPQKLRKSDTGNVPDHARA